MRANFNQQTLHFSSRDVRGGSPREKEIEAYIKDILEDLFLILPHVLGNLLYVLIEFFQVSLARLDQLFLEPLAIFLALQQELRIGAFAVQV